MATKGNCKLLVKKFLRLFGQVVNGKIHQDEQWRTEGINGIKEIQAKLGKADCWDSV